MKLIFVRHGQATAYCANDAGRNLTEFGQQQAQQTAIHLLTHYTPNVIITSPFNRAYQTAQAIYECAKNKGQQPQWQILDSITPDDDPAIAINHLSELVGKLIDRTDNDCAVVVCHMPIIARMVEILDGLPPEDFMLAQYKVLELELIADNLGTVVDKFIPKQP